MIELRRMVLKLQEEKDSLQSDHEYEIMKLENQMDEMRSGKSSTDGASSLNQIIKDQLVEIEHLRAKLKEKK